MQLRAVIGRAEIVALLRQAAPLRIIMTPDEPDRRWLEIEQPSSVELVAGRGVRVITRGRLRLDIAEVSVPVRIKEASLMLTPKIAGTGEDSRLVLAIAAERVDVAYLPNVVEDALLSKINTALAPVETRLAWRFGKKLSPTLRIPPRLEPLDTFRFSVGGAEIAISADAITVTGEMATELGRHYWGSSAMSTRRS